MRKSTGEMESGGHLLGGGGCDCAGNPREPLSKRTLAYICFLLSCKIRKLGLENEALSERHNLLLVYIQYCPGPSGKQLTLEVGKCQIYPYTFFIPFLHFTCWIKNIQLASFLGPILIFIYFGKFTSGHISCLLQITGPRAVF